MRVFNRMRREQTLQNEGVAVEPDGLELERCRGVYFAVWPDGADRLPWLGITHFCIKPVWLRYSDFDQSPPLVVEMSN